jgi:cell division protein FtsB
MNEKRRMAGLLVVCFSCAFILGCTSAPSITPEVIDVQTQLTDATDTLGDAIQDTADTAQEIAAVTAGTEYAELTARHAKEVNELVALHKTLEENVTAANELSLKLAGQSEELRTENLEQKTEIATLKGQRLALILILGFLFTLLLLYLYARIKKLV